MVKEYALMVNTEDCVGCNACEVACKQEHNLPVGPRWIRVYLDGPREIEGKLQLRYIVTHCMHCSDPLCRDACPVDAITKREDGLVLIDEELCIGCKDCIEACPWELCSLMRRKGSPRSVTSVRTGLRVVYHQPVWLPAPATASTLGIPRKS